MNGEIETLYERNLRIAIADALKKDRVETLRLAEQIARVTPTAATAIMKMLKERAS